MSQASVAVVGGGIAGLSAAWYLHRAGVDVALFEATDRLGGRIETGPFAGVDLDAGPDAFLARVPWAVDLCRELGIEDRLVSPATRTAYVWRGGALHPLPEDTVLGVPTERRALDDSALVSSAGADRAFDDLHAPDDHPEGDESVGSLCRRRLGDEVTDWLVGPLLGGINASDIDRLSVRAGAPQLAAALNEGPSLIAGLRAQRAAAGIGPDTPVFHTLPGGLGQLVTEIAAHLPPGVVRTETPVTALERRGGGGYQLAVPGGFFVTDGVIVATPAGPAARLLAAVAPEAAERVARIDYASVVMVAMAFGAGDIQRPLDASGFLVPAREDMLMTVCSWTSAKFAHLARPDQVLLRVSAGRFGDERHVDMGDDELVAGLLSDLRQSMGITASPDEIRIRRWPASFPQYTPGHEERIARAERLVQQRAPKLALCGAAYRGIGIPACIRDGKRAADLVSAQLGDC